MVDWQIAIRLIAAVVVGGLLGLNRELAGKPAGFRTHVLVCLGAATASVAALHSRGGAVIDPNAAGRVVQGVLTGIGFLGAGVILRDPAGHISGLTTAATVWICAVIGFVSAVANWGLLALVFVLTMIALAIGGAVERFTDRLFSRRNPQGNTNESKS